MYREYLRSPEWAKVKERVLQRDRHRCQNPECGSLENLEVHHVSYAHVGDEMKHLSDLITLCHDCHREVHGLEPQKNLDRILEETIEGWEFEDVS